MAGGLAGITGWWAWRRRVWEGGSGFKLPASFGCRQLEKVLVAGLRERYELGKVLMRIGWRPLVLTGLLSTFKQATIVFAPVFLQLIVTELDRDEGARMNLIIFYVVFLTFIQFLGGICHRLSKYRLAVLGNNVRSAIYLAVCRKALRLSPDALKHMNSSEIMTLLSSDVERLVEFILIFHEPILAPVILVALMSLLFYTLGVAFFAGLSVFFLAFVVNGIAFYYLSGLRSAQLKCTDERLHRFRDMLHGIKIVKVMTWEKSAIEFASVSREEEIRLSSLAYMLQSSQIAVMLFATPLALLTTFALYIGINSTMSPSVIFASIGLILSLRVPLIALPTGLGYFINAIISSKRLTEFFVAEEVASPSAIPGPHWKRNPNIIAHPIQLRSNLEKLAKHGVVIRLKSCTFSWNAEKMLDSSDITKTSTRGGGTEAEWSGQVNLNSQTNDNTPGDADFRLSHINLEVQKGNLVVVLGNVGSGKSSLLYGILGELSVISGTRHVFETTSFVPQEPWTFEGSIKANILMGKCAERERYESVIHSVDLHYDFAGWPAGDNTPMSSVAEQTSGGQRRRIGLARAAYSDAGIVLLDDPLVGLDVSVARKVFKRCICGVLSSRTRIVNARERFVAEAADKVILLFDGTSVWEGSGSDIKKLPIDDTPIVDHLLRMHNGQQQGMEETGHKYQRQGAFHDGLSNRPHFVSLPFHEKNRASAERGRDTIHRQRHDSTHRHLNHPTGTAPLGTLGHFLVCDTARFANPLSARFGWRPATNRDRPSSSPRDEQISTWRNHVKATVPDDGGSGARSRVHQSDVPIIPLHGNASLTTYYSYFVDGGLLQWTIIIILMTIGQVCLSTSEYWLAEWADVGDGTIGEAESWEYLSIYGGIGGAYALALLLASVLQGMAGGEASTKAYLKLLEAIVFAEMKFFDSISIGSLISVFSRDIDAIDTTLVTLLNVLFLATATLIGACVIIGIVIPYLFIAAFIFCTCAVFILSLYRRIIAKLVAAEVHHRIPTISFASTVASRMGVIMVRTYGMQQYFIRKYSQLIDRHGKCMWQIVAANNFLGLLLEVLSLFIMAGSYSLAIVMADDLGPGKVALVIINVWIIYASVSAIAELIAQVDIQIQSYGRIMHFCDLPQRETLEPTNWEYLSAYIEEPYIWNHARKYAPGGWPQTGALAMEKVCFRYSDANPLVLTNLSISIKPGEFVGIVGRTGSGKSSLAALLMRLFPLSDGSVKVDGVDTQSVGLHALRRTIGYLPQDPWLFRGTLREQLDLANNKSDDEIIKALADVGVFGISELLDMSLDDVIPEAGLGLSVGQQQLLCFARILLNQPQILILDEVAAHVDQLVEGIILDIVRGLIDRGKTVVWIAHKLDTVLQCDRVMVMDGGNVVECDTPERLLRDSESTFSRLIQNGVNGGGALGGGEPAREIPANYATGSQKPETVDTITLMKFYRSYYDLARSAFAFRVTSFSAPRLYDHLLDVPSDELVLADPDASLRPCISEGPNRVRHYL